MKSFSELTSASQVDNADLVAISQSTGNGYASKKTTVGDVTKGVYASNGVMGAKNLNKYPYYNGSSRTHNGITYTVDENGVVTANNTATATSFYTCNVRNTTSEFNCYLPNGKYTISGCPSGGSASSSYNITVYATIGGSGSALGQDFGSGANFEVNGDDFGIDGAYIEVRIIFASGYTANNLVFKPMIRLASDSDATFQPYAMTNLELTKAIESGGGGGTGGHTIIDENGNSMTARAGLQFVGANVDDDATNNKTIVDLASAGGIDGVFIDVDNVIQTVTEISASGLSYTATEDCFVYLYIWGGNSTVIKINNVEVGANYSADKDVYLISLKKGQILTTTSGSAYNTYTVYGIQTGTSHSKFQPVIYSTEEREIGVWTDGKPLYRRTYELSSSFVINAQTWGTTSIDVSFVDKIIGEADIVTAGGQGYVCFTDISNNNLQLYNPRHDAGIGVKFITIQYTKTTDTAGSGSWTPQGVPAVHYTTDEQVIGTWLGETLYQKTLHISNAQFDSTGVYDLDLTSMGTDVLIADNSCSYYTFSTYVRNFEKLVPKDGHIYCYGVANRPITDGYITIKYTKSS